MLGRVRRLIGHVVLAPLSALSTLLLLLAGAQHRPADARWAAERARQELREGKWRVARDMARLATRADPAYAEGYLLLGAALSSAGRRGEAETWYRRALAVVPGGPSGALKLADVLRGERRFDEARAFLAAAAAAWPDDPGVLLRAGNAEALAGSTASAVPLLRRAAEADPSNVRAHHSLAYALALLGRWTEAEAAASRALALEPDDGELRKLGQLIRHHTATRT